MTDDTTTAAPPADPEYVSRDEAATTLGITTRQLDRLVAAGRVTKYRRPVGRFKVSYKLADLRALIESAPAND